MDDRVVVAAAMAAAGAALAAPGVRPAVWLVVAAVATSVFLGVGARSSGSRRGPTGSPGGVPTSARGMALAALLAALVGVRADQDLGGLDRPLPKEVAGIAELGSDPRRSDLGTRVELVAGGRRYLAEFDRDSEAAVADLRTGDRLAVRGAPRPLRGAPQGWVRARHLSGRLRVDAVGPGGPTRPWFRAANAVHELLHRGSRSMSSGHRALYAGLVVGDDRGQDEVTRFRFRASGLAHLLAVSGQNLVFVLAVLSPLRSRLGFRWRWVLGVAAVGGFVLVTRAEPSVLRAAVMAVLGLTAAAGGRRIPGVRLVATAVVLLLLGDPLLVHSVGFRLSVAATLGLVLLAGPLGRLVPGPGWLARPLAVTVAAQAGAVPVMAATFGAVSVLAVPANLAAEPAAGAVMTLGLTSGLVAGAVREEVAGVLQAPVRVSVWWVDTVASAAAGLSAPPVGVGGWLAVVGGAGLAVGLWRVRGREGSAGARWWRSCRGWPSSARPCPSGPRWPSCPATPWPCPGAAPGTWCSGSRGPTSTLRPRCSRRCGAWAWGAWPRWPRRRAPVTTRLPWPRFSAPTSCRGHRRRERRGRGRGRRRACRPAPAAHREPPWRPGRPVGGPRGCV